MRALITGAGGQLGRELLATAPEHVQCVALDRHCLDIGDGGSVERALRRRKHKPVFMV
ncbi:MAG: sugar nucleotide-binding protein, partial [Pseudomonadales bacterium]